MTMGGKDRAALRAEAHHLRPTIHIGQHGISDTVRQALDDALAARELVKIRFEPAAELPAKEGANAIAADLDADVVQVIGRTATLYRHNPDLKRPAGGTLPWRR